MAGTEEIMTVAQNVFVSERKLATLCSETLTGLQAQGVTMPQDAKSATYDVDKTSYLLFMAIALLLGLLFGAGLVWLVSSN